MKTIPVMIAAFIAMVTLATASATLSHAQTTPTTSSAAPPVAIVLKRNSLTLTEGRKTATVKADRIIYQRGDKKKFANSVKAGVGFRAGVRVPANSGSGLNEGTGFLETSNADKEARYRLSGDYHIVNSDGWEWTGHDAELVITDITSSRGMKQNLVVVNAIGPMHQRRPITAPDGTKTVEEHDITDKPVAPGATAGVSFYINSPIYIMNKWGKEEIHFDN